MHELNNQEEESKGNTWEVDIVFKHIQQLVDDGVPMKHIGVITPYNLQVSPSKLLFSSQDKLVLPSSECSMSHVVNHMSPKCSMPKDIAMHSARVS